VPSITTEAQNSLLKTLEEPVAGALFFLITPAPETLLPTIRSRVQMLELPKTKELDALVDADVFLTESPEKRLVMLKPLYEHEDEGRDVGSVIAFLSSLERRFAKEKSTSERKQAIHAIYRARKYATDKGSLLKALLEQVALLCPKL
jgi:DNA polymerase III delta prime subunit